MPVFSGGGDGGGRERRAGARIVLRIVRAAAGGADIDHRRRGIAHRRLVIFVRQFGQRHPRLPQERTSIQFGCANGRDRHARPGGHALKRRQGTPPDARPNGRQVSWLAGRRPSPPSRAGAQWHCGTSSPLTVAGAAADLGANARTAFPFHSSKEETVNSRPINGLAGALSNGAGGAEFEAPYSFSARPCGSKGCLFRRQIKGPKSFGWKTTA